MKRPFLDAPPLIPNHTLYHSIGRGSYGEVWLATEDTLKRWRAVKVVSQRRDGGTDRGYQREFDAIQRYEDICRSHVSLMAILTVGRDVDDRFFFYSMDLADDVRTNGPLAEAVSSSEGVAPSVEGYEPRTLRSELRRKGRVSPADCVAMGIALANALEQLHRHGLIHRDIKPDNIIFVAGQPKFADVGLVAEVDATNSLAGTDAYLSPEFPRKEPADIFALGKVLYEMATGEEVGEFPALPKGFAGLTDRDQTGINELSAVFCRACEPGVQERYPSAKHLREDLELLKQNGSVVRSRDLERQNRRLRRIVRTAVVWSTVVLALLVVGALVIGMRYYQARSAEQALESVLQEGKFSRLSERYGGWHTNHWSKLDLAARTLGKEKVGGQAVAVLAGSDAELLWKHEKVNGTAAAFAPDGRVLVAGATVPIRRVNSPALIFDPNGVKTELAVRGDGRVCWAADGRPLHFTSLSNRCVLSEADTGKVRREFPFHDGQRPVESTWPVVAISADGRMTAAAVIGTNGRARAVAWNAASGETLGEAPLRASALAFSPDGALLAVGGLDARIEVYAMPGFSRVASLPPAVRPTPIYGLAFGRDVQSRDDSAGTSHRWLLGAGDQGAAIVIWDLNTQTPRSFCRGSAWNVQSLAFHPDGLTLASAGRGGVKLWDVMTGQLLLRLEHAAGSDTRALAFNEDGTRIFAGSEWRSSQAECVCWKLEPHHGIHALRGFVSNARGMWFSPDNRLLAALSDDWQLAFWEAESGKLLRLFHTPIGDLADNAAGMFDAQSKRFAFATLTNACLYDLESGRILHRWVLARGYSEKLQFDGGGRLLLARREGWPGLESLRFWHLYELGDGDVPKLLHRQSDIDWRTGDVFFRPGGDRFLVSGTNLTSGILRLRAHDVASGRELWRSDTDRTDVMLAVFLDPTGQWFAYPYKDDKFRRMRWEDFGEVALTRKNYQAIGPTGREFAANEWLFWDPRGEQYSVPFGTDWLGGSVPPAFSRDGKYLARGTEQRVVLLVHLAEARRRLDSLGKGAR